MTINFASAQARPKFGMAMIYAGEAKTAERLQKAIPGSGRVDVTSSSVNGITSTWVGSGKHLDYSTQAVEEHDKTKKLVDGTKNLDEGAKKRLLDASIEKLRALRAFLAAHPDDDQLPDVKN